MHIRISPNPQGNWLGWLLLVPLLIVSAAFGLVVLLAILALAALALAIFMTRVWWLRRRMRRQAAQSGALEGEYVVVREEIREDVKRS